MSILRRPVRLLDSVHEGVLGTRLILKVRDPRASTLRRCEQILLAEIDRLERVFSVYRPDSELSRWKSAAGETPASDELVDLLRLALDWCERSDGAFNPAVGALSERWKLAEAESAAPSAADLRALVTAIRVAPYRFDGSRLVVTGDCSALNFNALAKGLIVDLACAAVIEGAGPTSLVVNIGGDLVHMGAGSAAVRVEDPHRPFANAAPLRTVSVGNAGLATSGSTKRGVRIGDRWYSHVIDPRSGRPVDTIASASVVARDAATADVVATVVSVLPPAEGVAFVDGLADDVACLIVASDRTVSTNRVWDRLEIG